MNKTVLPICFSTDDNYVLPTCVAIQSIKNHLPPKDKYKVMIYILYEKLSSENQLILKNLSTLNLDINFINISEYLKNCKFYSTQYFSIAMYYRFFIPLIFKDFDKILYLDCDLIINRPFYSIFNTDLTNKTMGVVRDIFKQQPDYFNSGVILFNTKEFIKQDISTKLLDYVNNNQNLRFPDQDALNAVCQNSIKFLSREFNFAPITLLSDYQTIKYLNIRKFNNVKIFHYYEAIKPWHCRNYPYYNKWWKTVKTLPKEIQNRIKQTYPNPIKVKMPKIKIWKLYSIFGEKFCDFICKISKNFK